MIYTGHISKDINTNGYTNTQKKNFKNFETHYEDKNITFFDV